MTLPTPWLFLNSICCVVGCGVGVAAAAGGGGGGGGKIVVVVVVVRMNCSLRCERGN